MKIILAGTPEFSVPIFENIIKKYQVLAIITQPDKNANRGMQLQESPVSFLAKKYNIKLYKPNKIIEIFEELSKMNFDFFLTAAFGQYIPTKILNLPKKAALNIHGSLLPKYRGAAPIQHAIWNGDKKTGISLIYMVKKMDAGNILKTANLIINDDDNSKSLFKKMSLLAAKKINFWLKDIYENNFKEIVQDETQAVFSPKLKKKDAFLDANNLTSLDFFNKVRAFNPNPGAFLFINKKRVKVFKTSFIKIKNALEIKTKDQNIYLIKYQFEGKKIIEIN